MQRGSGAVVLALLIGLSALATPVGAGSPDASAPPDPAADVLGWEDGYWYNETLQIDASDGLSADERAALGARTMARIEHLRGLEFRRPVPVSVRSRTNFSAEVGNRTTNDTLRTFDNAKFEALFLVNESTDSIDVQDRNSGSSVLGYYDPSSEQIVLVAENESAVTIDEATLAHELVHALQDQHFNLSRFAARTRDRHNAYRGLIEGDATYVEYLYSNRRCDDPSHPWNGTCVSPPAGGSGSGSLANLGVYFLTFQPYSDGPAFVAHARRSGGWEAVNARYEAPPETAEQVIHPERYGVDPPTNVSLEDRTSGSWERVVPEGRPGYATVGQAGVASMLVFPLYESGGRTQIVSARAWLNVTPEGEISPFDPLDYGFEAADGWDGDRLHVYRNDANETAYVWRLVWDSAADAEEFAASYREVVEFWGGEAVGPSTYLIADGGFADAIYLDVDGETVTVVNAPTRWTLTQVYDGVERHTPTPRPTRRDPGFGTSPVPTGIGADTPSGTASMTPSGPETATPGQVGFGLVAALLAIGVWLAHRRAGGGP